MAHETSKPTISKALFQRMELVSEPISSLKLFKAAAGDLQGYLQELGYEDTDIHIFLKAMLARSITIDGR